MNLAEMLTYADIGHLSKIANHYQCRCNENSKNELIQSILHQVGRKEFIKEHVHQLSVEDFRFLNTLLFDQKQHFSLEELIACAQHSRFTEVAKAKENPRDVIARFRQRGWLFNGSSLSTKYLFELPEDLKDRFREVLGQKLVSEVVQGIEPSVYREEQGLISEDLFLLIRDISKQDIPLNQEGIMYKRNQQLLMDLLHVSEPLVSKGGWRFGYGRTFTAYPDRFSLLYDFAYSQKWLDESQFQLNLTASGLQFALDEKRIPVIQLVHFWLKSYKAAIPNLLSLMVWIDRSSRTWVNLNSLKQTMVKLIKPYYYDTAESIFEERIVKMMLHLGLVRVGEDEQHERYMEMTVYGTSIVMSLQSSHEKI
ncbi:hypothetical protein J2Z69_000576 [Paenibacillus shirakamiensis]|uniref:Helicase XPB/Ssl2 N-terminal domain-containing protein n=1 Tax=Paenibacillus shirakamiensis TaxID=1265935 RepID=A0ABS4JCV4_9BACL|nr:hypothetical protein [Paenibacillus shirakamiensis]MBP1999557.1 hypothetical protein [Paenibacillus shirakamiensis]